MAGRRVGRVDHPGDRAAVPGGRTVTGHEPTIEGGAVPLDPGSTVLDEALAFLAQHPGSSARTIAVQIGRHDRDVFRELDNAAYQGKCQRSRASSGPWLWEVPQ
jgi:hypothetical protein